MIADLDVRGCVTQRFVLFRIVAVLNFEISGLIQPQPPPLPSPPRKQNFYTENSALFVFVFWVVLGYFFYVEFTLEKNGGSMSCTVVCRFTKFAF